MASEEKGFFAALFDLSFSSFVTTRLIKLLYILIIVLAGLAGLGVIGASIQRGPLGLLVGLIVGGVMFFLWVLMGRVWLKLIIVMFRIAEHVRNIAEQKTKGGDAASN